jgi:hypothetical protein
VKVVSPASRTRSAPLFTCDDGTQRCRVRVRRGLGRQRYRICPCRCSGTHDVTGVTPSYCWQKAGPPGLAGCTVLQENIAAADVASPPDDLCRASSPGNAKPHTPLRLHQWGCADAPTSHRSTPTPTRWPAGSRTRTASASRHPASRSPPGGLIGEDGIGLDNNAKKPRTHVRQNASR